MLLTVDDWERTLARTVPDRPNDLPVVGIDLGGGRAWSSAVAVHQNGLTEAIAVAPGLPDIEAQEKRDRVPAGLYAELVETGALRIAEGLRVQPPSMLWHAVKELWGGARVIVCDRFRLPDLRDATAGEVPILERIPMWSQSSEDIRALRKLASDGPLSVALGSRDLLTASLGVAQVKTDTAGNSRLEKRGTNNCARDDVAAALLLAAGEVARLSGGPDEGEYEVRNLGYAA